jgi:hypothetical protein
MSKWRDIYEVHPAADVFPMMPEDGLAKLQEDIERHGVRVPIGLYDETDAKGRKVKTWLIDGRNRLEATERAGINLKYIPKVHIHCSDPVTWIIALNILRRHLTKQEQAKLIVAAHKAAEAARVARQADKYIGRDGEPVSRQADVKLSKRGRAEGRKPDKVKAAAVADAAKAGISKSTIERVMAEAEGKKPSERPRRTDAEIGRDKFLGSFRGAIEAIGTMSFSDTALDLLTMEQKDEAIADMEKAIASLRKMIDQLRLRDRKTA